MSTILIDRRTAALLGEMAATRSRGRLRSGEAVDGVSLGVQVADSPVVVARRPRSAGVRRSDLSTRRAARGAEEVFSPGDAVTVRRPSAAEARLRRRLRCQPRGGQATTRGSGWRATQSGRGFRRRPGALHLTRRGRLAALLLFLVVLTVAFSVGRVTSSALGAPDGAGAEVTVHRGDTLWSIAERIAPNTDPRSTAADLMAVNGLATPSLEVGQHLRLP